MARKPFVCGNWKMNTLPEEGMTLARQVAQAVGDQTQVDVAVAPPFVHLALVGNAVDGTSVKLAAQNVHDAEKGAYTGEVSAPMLRAVGCTYVIVGHSERRQYFGDDDAWVNRKVKALLAQGLEPILCVGESLEEREADRTLEVVEGQVRGGLADVERDQLPQITVAYEPVWAIGTGRTASPEQAQEVHAFIRRLLGEIGGAEAAEGMRIQYGGSMKPENAAELLAQPDVDGGLIGGASLKADAFAAIVEAAKARVG